MKKQNYLAGFQLAARHTLRPLLLICALLALWQLGSFWWFSSSKIISYDTILEQGNFSFAFRLACICLCISSISVSSGKNHAGFFTRRLALPLPRLSLLWGGNLFCNFLILWGFQLFLLVLCLGIYQINIPPEYFNHQTFYLSFFQNAFLYALLPLGDFIIAFRNIIMVLALCLSSALAVYSTWQQEPSKLWGFALLLFYPCFPTSGSSLDGVILILFLFIGLAALIRMVGEVEQ